MKMHIATHENEKMQHRDQILQCCPYCNFKGNLSRKNSHIKTVHDRILQFQCKFCEYSTSKSTDLKSHNATKHEDENLQPKNQILERCSYCNLQGRLSNKNMHIMTVHDQIKHKNESLQPKNPIIKSCSFCSFKGRSNHTYRHIMNIHDQIRPFKCKLCEFSAANLFNLKRRHNVNKHKI
jgi:KRAB domain-containing zinc finger protein